MTRHGDIMAKINTSNGEVSMRMKTMKTPRASGWPAKVGRVLIFTMIFAAAFVFDVVEYNGLLQEAWAVDAAPRITDREIIESLAELKAGQKGIEGRLDGIEKRMDGIEKRMERLETVMMGGFGLLFTAMMGLVGFVLWDRRTALAPAINKNKELEEREERLEKALKEYAMEEPRLKEIFKHAGLL